MALAKGNIYTIQDILELPENERAELIAGNMFMQAAPSRIHQKIVSFLHLEIGNYIRKKVGSVRFIRHRLQFLLSRMIRIMWNRIFLLSATRKNWVRMDVMEHQTGSEKLFHRVHQVMIMLQSLIYMQKQVSENIGL